MGMLHQCFSAHGHQLDAEGVDTGLFRLKNSTTGRVFNQYDRATLRRAFAISNTWTGVVAYDADGDAVFHMRRPKIWKTEKIKTAVLAQFFPIQ
jgi:hypothetical protein